MTVVKIPTFLSKATSEMNMTINEYPNMQFKSVQEFIVVNKLTPKHQRDLLTLYSNEWWCHDRTWQDVEKALQNSSLIVGIVEPSKDRLVGFARALTDYFKYAYIYDVIVDQKYRGLELGKRLLMEILQHKDIKILDSIELVCRKDMLPFYEQFGFTANYGDSLTLRRHRNNK